MPESAEKQSWLNRTVLGVGLTSLFSDWSHETATAVLPAFLAAIGAGPAWLGAIEGIADGLSSFAKLAAGHFTDRLKRRKPLAVFGYAFTALATASFAFATHAYHVLFSRAAAWLGRGVRSPAKKGLLAADVPPNAYGRAFGLERLMDTLGAIGGPLTASPAPPASPSAFTRSTTFSMPAPLTRVAGSAITFRTVRLCSPLVMPSPVSRRFSFAPERILFRCSRSFSFLRGSTSARKKPSKTPSPPRLSPRNNTAWPSARSPPSTPSVIFSPASWSDSSGAPSTSRPPSLPPPSSFSPVPFSFFAFEPRASGPFRLVKQRGFQSRYQNIPGPHSSLPTRFSDSRRARRRQRSFRRKSALRIERGPARHGARHLHRSVRA